MTPLRRFVLPFLFFVLSLYVSGCVDLPDDEPPRSDPTSEVRIINMAPNIPTAVISMALGHQDFKVFTDLPSAGFLTVNPYVTHLSGGKKLFLRVPLDADTTTLTFPTRGRGSVYILPRLDSTDTRFIFIYERYTFAPPAGKRDTARIRFLNFVSSQDTIDIVRVRGRFTSFASNDLLYGKASSFGDVARTDTVKFYVTRYNSTSRIDSLTINGGAPGKLYSVAVYDSLSVAKFKMIEEN